MSSRPAACLVAARAMISTFTSSGLHNTGTIRVSRTRPFSISITARMMATPSTASTSGHQHEQANTAAEYDFGPYKIRSSELFAATQLSYAFVNLKPVVPGHVLVSPKRVAKRFAELTADEVADLWVLAKKVGAAVEKHFEGQSLTFAIQDGPQAGQTVPHVHIHILPRRMGDFPKNDQVYDEIEKNSKELNKQHGERLDLDKERTVRTPEEMAAEAAELAKYFQDS